MHKAYPLSLSPPPADNDDAHTNPEEDGPDDLTNAAGQPEGTKPPESEPERHEDNTPAQREAQHNASPEGS